MTEREHMIHSITRALYASEKIGIDIIQVSDDAARKLLELLKAQPTIVRCKDCRYCYAEGFVHEHNVCDKHEEIKGQPDDWYCADGEAEQNDSV